MPVIPTQSDLQDAYAWLLLPGKLKTLKVLLCMLPVNIPHRQQERGNSVSLSPQTHTNAVCSFPSQEGRYDQ